MVLEEQRGSLYILTVRGERQDIIQYFDNMDLLFFEVLPLSLEEIFISETEVVGYDIKNSFWIRVRENGRRRTWTWILQAAIFL